MRHSLVGGVFRVREPFCSEPFGNALSGAEDQIPVQIARKIEVPVLSHPHSELFRVFDNISRVPEQSEALGGRVELETLRGQSRECGDPHYYHLVFVDSPLYIARCAPLPRLKSLRPRAWGRRGLL